MRAVTSVGNPYIDAMLQPLPAKKSRGLDLISANYQEIFRLLQSNLHLQCLLSVYGPSSLLPESTF